MNSTCNSHPRALVTRFLLLIVAVSTLACASGNGAPTLSGGSLSRAEEREAREAFEDGLAHVEAGDYEAALVDFTRVVESFPSSRDSGTALFWQGWTYYQLGDDGRAAAALERYLRLADDVPRREHATLLLANAIYGQGRYDEALEVALSIEHAPAERLGEFLALAGDVMERVSRDDVERVARERPIRNWLAPLYLQSARWAIADGETERGRQLAREVSALAELPPELRSQAETISAGATEDVPARLGFIAPTEGRFASVSEEIRRGIEIALNEVNRGRSAGFELITRSTASDADSTIGVIRSLARGERVSAIVGPLTSEYAIPAGQAADEEGVVLISPTATDARLLEMGPEVFTINALDGAIGHTIGLYATRTLGRRQLAILAPENAYGRVQADAFAAAVETGGGRIVYRGDYPDGSTTFTDRLGDIVRSRADAVFLATNRPNEALRILNQMAFFELDNLLPLGTDAWNDETFASQGRRFARGYFADTFSRDERITTWRSFAAQYESLFGEAPKNRIAAWGHDAVRLAVRPSDGDAVGSASPPSQAFQGASGLFRLTPQGPRRAVVVHRVERGAAVAVDW